MAMSPRRPRNFYANAPRGYPTVGGQTTLGDDVDALTIIFYNVSSPSTRPKSSRAAAANALAKIKKTEWPRHYNMWRYQKHQRKISLSHDEPPPIPTTEQIHSTTSITVDIVEEDFGPRYALPLTNANISMLAARVVRRTGESYSWAFHCIEFAAKYGGGALV